MPAFDIKSITGVLPAMVTPFDAELRVELVASHLMGLAFARYQLKIEPIASTSVEELVAIAGPTMQRYLTEPLT